MIPSQTFQWELNLIKKFHIQFENSKPRHQTGFRV